MSNLQITLSIVGVLLIIAIIGHGLWTMRRNNQQMTQQARNVAENRERASSRDMSFDDDGIGEVRTIKNTERTSAAKQHDKQVQPSADELEQMSMNLDIDEDDSPLPSMRVDKEEDAGLQQAEFELTTDAEMPEKEQQQAKQTPAQQEVQEKPEQPQPQETSPQPAQEVISLFVKGSVQGAVLLQMMTELGCKFGEIGIFHRYEQTSGNGPLIFSVANMFNPGTFDLDNIENFETDGVALFMTLPLNYDGQQAYNMMLNAAKKLAMEIPQGQVLDGERKVLSRLSIQKAHQTIREFEKAQATT